MYTESICVAWFFLLMGATCAYLSILGVGTSVVYFALACRVSPSRGQRRFSRRALKHCCFALLMCNHVWSPVLMQIPKDQLRYNVRTHQMPSVCAHKWTLGPLGYISSPAPSGLYRSTQLGFSIHWVLCPFNSIFLGGIGRGAGRSQLVSPTGAARWPHHPSGGTWCAKFRVYDAHLIRSNSPFTQVLPQCHVMPTLDTGRYLHLYSAVLCSSSLFLATSDVLGRRSVQPLVLIPCTKARFSLLLLRIFGFPPQSVPIPSLFIFDVFSPCLGFPGEGPFTIASVNVTSLPKNKLTACSLSNYISTPSPVRVVCMQETRIPTHEVSNLESDCRDTGWQILVGFQPSAVAVSNSNPSGAKFLRQRQGGLATLVASSQFAYEIPYPDNWKFLYEFCQAVWIATDSSSGFVIANCYLPAHQTEHEKRCQVMESLFEYLSTFTSPVCLCGDFQNPPGENQAIADAIIHGGFEDVVALKDSIKGSRSKFTFSAQGWNDPEDPTGKSRIDFFLASPKFLPLVADCEVHQQVPLPGHACVTLSVRVDAPTFEAWTTKPHPKWSLPAMPKSEAQWEQRNALCTPFYERYQVALAQAAEECDIESAWTIACKIATSMLNCVSVQDIPYSRGKLPSFVQRRVAGNKPSKHSPLQSFCRAKKLCHEIQIKLMRVRNGLNAVDLWATARNLNQILNRHGSVLILPHEAASLACWSAFLHNAENVLSKLEKDFHENRSHFRITKWKQRMRVSSRSDRRAVHRWLRDEPLGYPKAFKTPTGFTCDPNKMLSMLTSHMSSIYNFHKDKDVSAMIRDFRQKYHQSIDSLTANCANPDLSFLDIFHLVQQRPSCKAGGLDGWLSRELKQLPPVGWKGFVIVMKLAECVGEWPQAIRTISVYSISKGLGNASPEVTRAIGVSSIVYSVWSSLRFRHLSQWHLDIAPATLYGGLQGRRAQDSELKFSQDLHDHSGDHLSVFIDRWKCFDLIIPELAISIASDLGLPRQIAVAIQGFYCNQTKFFKLGPYFGNSVMSTNAAVQGCSMSIIMVNSMFSVLAHHISMVAPSVSLANFIDDCKIWSSERHHANLQHALEEIQSFDASVGQVLNVGKTNVMSRFRKKAARFVRDVKQPFHIRDGCKELPNVPPLSCKLQGLTKLCP